MRKAPTVGLALLVLLAGCGGLSGGPNVVQKECVVSDSFTACEAVVENPGESAMTVNVTAEVGSKSKSKTVDLDPGERKNVSMTLSVAGDVQYSIDVREVDS